MSSDENGENGGRTITIGKIVSYGFGILFILTGLVSLVTGIGGILILLGGVFALPPVRRRITSRTGISFSRGVVVLIVVALIVAGGAAFPQSGDSDQAASSGGGADGGGAIPTTTPTPTTAPTPTTTPTQQSVRHEIGESFTVGSGDQSIQYRVDDSFSQESVGSSAVGTEADGIYLVVILEIENVGDESFDITDRHLRAVDDQDREYEANFEASAYAESDPRIDTEGITYEQLNPGLKTMRAVIFDVNPGAEYRLKIEPVGVFSSADTHYVTIGSVESESG